MTTEIDYADDAALLEDPRAKQIAGRIREDEAWFGIMTGSRNGILRRLAAQIMISAIRDELVPARTLEGVNERERKRQANKRANETPEERDARRAYFRDYYHRSKAGR